MNFARISFGYLATSILLGAFGAHSLKSRLAQSDLAIFKTGQDYQTVAALTLILMSVLMIASKEIELKKQFTFFFAGSLVFSLSLYALALTGQKVLGAITPIGGVLMISALVSVCLALPKNKGI